MSATALRIAERAAEMRRAFDRAFAAPVSYDRPSDDGFLAIKMCGRHCAIRLAEISGLYAGKKITPLPGSVSALRGVAGFRGAIVPVYDLAVALGLPAAESPRWLVTAKAAPAAFAFDGFERQLRATPASVIAQAGAELRGCTRGVLRTADFSGSIIHLPSALDLVAAPT